MLLEFNRQLTILTRERDELQSKLKQIQRMNQNQIALSNLSVEEVLEAIAINVPTPESFWDAIAEVYGSRYFHSVISLEYGIDLKDG